MSPRLLPMLLTVLLVAAWPAQAQMLDDAQRQQAQQLLQRGLNFLKPRQGADGSWSPRAGPAITAMVLRVMLDDPATNPADPAAQRALEYVLTKAKPDGGIHDGLLENYNTAICLSTLAKLRNKPAITPLIALSQEFLRNLQWSNQNDPQGKPIDASHPFYGGAGYGNDGRPDMSNTQMMIQGLHDSGLDTNDPAYQRALVFITRCQGVPQNKEYASRIRPDGGFIYATSLNKEKIGQLESKAGSETIDIPDASGGVGPTNVLRTYGSMTYAGFKSYLYANLKRDDPRVTAAYDWIRNNYTLAHNPGMPEPQKMQGYYYYILTFSRAMRAWGEPTITIADGQTRRWAHDMIAHLAATQQPDGSWTNTADRWMEGDPNLTTAYVLQAIQEALR